MSALCGSNYSFRAAWPPAAKRLEGRTRKTVGSQNSPRISKLDQSDAKHEQQRRVESYIYIHSTAIFDKGQYSLTLTRSGCACFTIGFGIASFPWGGSGEMKQAHSAGRRRRDVSRVSELHSMPDRSCLYYRRMVTAVFVTFR